MPCGLKVAFSMNLEAMQNCWKSDIILRNNSQAILKVVSDIIPYNKDIFKDPFISIIYVHH